MTISELEGELESATDSALQISLLNSLLKKVSGPKKQEYMKQLVYLYKDSRETQEFMDLAPTVLKHDSSDVDLRLTLIKKLVAAPGNYLLARTELHRLEA